MNGWNLKKENSKHKEKTIQILMTSNHLCKKMILKS